MSYKGQYRDDADWAQLHSFVLTDYGYCSKIDAPILFHPLYRNLSYSELENKVVAQSYREDARQNDLAALDEFISVGVGKRQGLEVLVDAEAYDYGYAPDPGEGIKVGISNFRDESPITVKGMDFSTGTVQQVIIKPILTSTTLVAKNRFSPEVRGCYFQDEYRLKDFSYRGLRYSLDNCLIEAERQAVARECGCDYYVEYRFSSDYMPCFGENYTCYRRHMDNFGTYNKLNSTDRRTTNKQCLPACVDQSNEVVVASTSHPNLHIRATVFCTAVGKMIANCNVTYKAEAMAEVYGPDACGLVSNRTLTGTACDASNPYQQTDYFMDLTAVDERLKDVVLEYTRDNILSMEIFFADNAVTKVVKDEKLSFIWYIAAIGGILGLCMGMSVITFFELLWYSMKVCKVFGTNTTRRFRESVRPEYQGPI